jgi:hypothetical protein
MNWAKQDDCHKVRRQNCSKIGARLLTVWAVSSQICTDTRNLFHLGYLLDRRDLCPEIAKSADEYGKLTFLGT